MNHIGVHLNWGQKVDPLYEWRPPVVVTANLSPELAVFKQESPATILVARGFPDDSRNPNFNAPFNIAERARADTEDAVRNTAQCSPDVIQVTNEPVISKYPLGGRDAMRRQADYDMECARIAREYGYRTSFGNWAVGTPEVGLVDCYQDAIGEATKLGCPLLLHEYDLQGESQVWTLYRHRLWYSALPSWITKKLRIIIGETGLHWQEGNLGWQGRVAVADYLNWIRMYDAVLHDLPYVCGAAIFAKSEYDPKWWSFDITPFMPDLLYQANPVYRPLVLPQPPPRPLLGRYFPGEDLRGLLPVSSDQMYDARGLDQVDKTIIHHTGRRPAQTDAAYILGYITRTAEHHLNLNWPGIGYHAMVGPEGDAYLVNSLRQSSYHAGKQNPTSFGVCMIGRFDEGWDMPTEAQIAKVNAICDWLGRPVYPHKFFMKTACPGRYRNMAIPWAPEALE